QLQVRMVLEGSVRKQDDRVRITAQLIDAKKGYHVWSQTYDRKLSDIFAIQDEIAKAIGDELHVQIVGTPEAGKSASGTRNIDAYDLYLRGITLWQTRRGDSLWQAIGLFEQATRADPKFAQGFGGLAVTYAVIGDYSGHMPVAETLARAIDFAELALTLDASLPEAYAALGSVAGKEFRRVTADALLGRAIELRPSFATAYQWRGTVLLTSGDLAGGLASLERASALDPRSLVVAENHAFALRALGRDAEAKARCMRALEIDPAYVGCLEDVALVDLQSGNLEAARSILERLAAAEKITGTQGKDLIEALAGRGDKRALARRYAALPFDSYLDPSSGNMFIGYDMPSVLMLLGEPQLALEYTERLAGEAGGTADWTVVLPAMDPIRCDPRFVAVIDRLKTKDPYFAKVCGKKG
ncbi:MAG TPA: hypothetical protein VLB69_11140, partial [Rudaea sp.]|nr:hypothetical protein [Rudaea sp.]